MTTHRISFAVPPNVFEILVTLIAGNDDNHARFAAVSDGIKDACDANDIDLKSLSRAAVTISYQWLSGEMKDDLWICRANCL
jgi:hypothetical protein